MSSDLDNNLRGILAMVAEHDDPWVTTREVAGQTDYVRRTVYNKLSRLTEHGLIESKQVGSNGRGWWITDAGHRRLTEDARSTPTEEDDQPSGSPPGEQPSAGGEGTDSATIESGPDPRDTAGASETSETTLWDWQP